MFKDLLLLLERFVVAFEKFVSPSGPSGPTISKDDSGCTGRPELTRSDADIPDEPDPSDVITTIYP